VVRGKVLHEHEGHAGLGVGRHGREEGFERGKPACRCANTNDRTAAAVFRAPAEELLARTRIFLRSRRILLNCSHVRLLPRKPSASVLGAHALLRRPRFLEPTTRIESFDRL
jgi:hypothetical protein